MGAAVRAGRRVAWNRLVFDLLWLKAAHAMTLAPTMPEEPDGRTPAPDYFSWRKRKRFMVIEILDSRQLRTFVTLARTGSFTHTAKEVFLTQSAVSHSIKALEADVGCRLLNRVGKKISLTLAGEQLLQQAERILHDMTTTRAALKKLGKWGETQLRVGASISTCQHLLPGILREFKREHPHCRLLLEAGDSPVLTEAVRQQRIDLGITLAPQNEPLLEFQPLFTDELVFIVDPRHPWAKAGTVQRSEIPQQNYILYSRNSHTFRAVEGYFRAEGMVLNTVMELGSVETIKELVKIGVGVSVLATWIAGQELREGSLVALPLGRRKLRRNWGVVHRQRRPLSLPEADFVQLCRKAVASFTLDGGNVAH